MKRKTETHKNLRNAELVQSEGKKNTEDRPT